MTVRQVYEICRKFSPFSLSEEDVKKICVSFDTTLKSLYEDKIPEMWKESDESLLVPYPFDDVYWKLVLMRAAIFSYDDARICLLKFLGKQTSTIQQKEE